MLFLTALKHTDNRTHTASKLLHLHVHKLLQTTAALHVNDEHAQVHICAHLHQTEPAVVDSHQHHTIIRLEVTEMKTCDGLGAERQQCSSVTGFVGLYVCDPLVVPVLS